METIVTDESPLAQYLKDESEQHSDDGGASQSLSDPGRAQSSPASSVPSFAPRSRLSITKRVRDKLPDRLRLDTVTSWTSSEGAQRREPPALSGPDSNDNSRFLEQFRYTIVASQLLTSHSFLPQSHPVAQPSALDGGQRSDAFSPSTLGVSVTVACAAALAWGVRSVGRTGGAPFSLARLAVVLISVAIVVVLSRIYLRGQRLRLVRERSLHGVVEFVAGSQELDGAIATVLGLVQEVELVARGYRISAPLPPISRIEDRSQTRRCGRLRKAMNISLGEVTKKQSETLGVVKAFVDPLDLEKYYDIYDINDFDIADALHAGGSSANSPEHPEDAESVRVLKISAARFHTLRKMFMCTLLALDSTGDESDFLRWTTVAEALGELFVTTRNAHQRLQSLLSEEAFVPPSTPRHPLTPGRERWRAQLRKLGSLSTGIRGLQAKLHLLREESDRTLNEADDISELGTNLVAQYESIGQDLRALVQAWDEGRTSLAIGIDRNEKRLSSMSTVFSPTTSVSGFGSLDEEPGGGAAEALKALTGGGGGAGSPSSAGSVGGADLGDVEEEVVFEGVSIPVPPLGPARNPLSRQERIARMKEERERKAEARQQAEATMGMMKELESVISLRPKKRRSTPATNRIMSL